VKKALTVGLAGAALAATLSLVGAGSFTRGQAPDALPPNQILTAVRAMGLSPTTEPLRRGPYYVLHAYDPRGIEVRVVADAQLGDILSIIPARVLNTVYTPHYVRGPHIIHVPQPGERDEHASTNDRDDPNDSDNRDFISKDDDAEVAPPALPTPRKRVKARRQYHSDAPPPPPPGPRRNVLSAPPPPAEGLTPIRPLPRTKSKADSGEKFASPDNAAVTSNVPAPLEGYTPPAGLPRDDKSDN